MAIASHVAVVPWGGDVDAGDLTRVAAALQKQVTRDFGPLWDVEATVDAFARWDDVPSDYWRISLVSPEALNVAGRHDVTGPGADVLGQPYALVAYQEGWAATASHECLEMLADPFGRRLVAGASPQDDSQRVEFLVEVCNPCQAIRYPVNGEMLCDFCTPRFFDPFAAPGVRYSFTGSITRPRDVLPGGYLSWYDPVRNSWWRRDFLGSGWRDYELGPARATDVSLRAAISQLRRDAPGVEGFAPPPRDTRPATAVGRAAQAKSAWLEPQLRSRLDGARASAGSGNTKGAKTKRSQSKRMPPKPRRKGNRR